MKKKKSVGGVRSPLIHCFGLKSFKTWWLLYRHNLYELSQVLVRDILDPVDEVQPGPAGPYNVKTPFFLCCYGTGCKLAGVLWWQRLRYSY